MNNLKLITVICLLMQGCSSSPKQANMPIEPISSIILTPQAQQVFDNEESELISPMPVTNQETKKSPLPTLEELQPTRTYKF